MSDKELELIRKALTHTYGKANGLILFNELIITLNKEKRA